MAIALQWNQPMLLKNQKKKKCIKIYKIQDKNKDLDFN